MVKWVIDEGTLVDLPVVGEPNRADVEVTVEPGGEISTRCLCPACQEFDNIGVVEAMGDLAETPGVYYMKAWSVVYPATPNGPEEYDGGIEIA